MRSANQCCTAHVEGVGLDDLCRPLPTQTLLWFSSLIERLNITVRLRSLLWELCGRALSRERIYKPEVVWSFPALVHCSSSVTVTRKEEYQKGKNIHSELIYAAQHLTSLSRASKCGGLLKVLRGYSVLLEENLSRFLIAASCACSF